MFFSLFFFVPLKDDNRQGRVRKRERERKRKDGIFENSRKKETRGQACN